MATPDILESAVQLRDIGVGRPLSPESLESFLYAFAAMPDGVGFAPRVIPGINYIGNHDLQESLARYPRELEPDEIEELTQRLVANGIESGKLGSGALEPITATIVGVQVKREQNAPSALSIQVKDVPDEAYNEGFQMAGEKNAIRRMTGNKLRGKPGKRIELAPNMVIKIGNVTGNAELADSQELKYIGARMGMRVTLGRIGTTASAEML